MDTSISLRTTSRLCAAVACLFAAHSISVSAADFSLTIFDGLGRPVSGASVEVYFFKPVSSNGLERVSLARVASDTNGLAKGTYDEKTLAGGASFSIHIAKNGYAGITAGPQAEYVLKRQFGPTDIPRIAKLSSEPQRAEMRELLAGEFDSETNNLNELVFFNSRQLRPPLRSLVEDVRVGTRAGELLAFIGVPDDLKLLVQFAPTPRREPLINRWAYRVVTALLEPPGEREWAFLKRCALNEYTDRWVDLGAIRTLKLIASSRSLEILNDVRKQNRFRTNEIDLAIEYINSRPALLEDKDLGEAGKKTAAALKSGDWRGNHQPTFNQEGDMALIDLEFFSGRQFTIYTATFHKVGEVWKLRGVRETREAVLPKSAAAEPKAPR